MSRSLSIIKTDVNPSSGEQQSYANIVKFGLYNIYLYTIYNLHTIWPAATIILKSDMIVRNGDKTALKNKFDDALRNVNVHNARVTENGNISWLIYRMRKILIEQLII